MKIQIIHATTIKGAAIAAGEVIEVDKETFILLKSQGQAKLYVQPETIQESAPEQTENIPVVEVPKRKKR